MAQRGRKNQGKPQHNKHKFAGNKGKGRGDKKNTVPDECPIYVADKDVASSGDSDDEGSSSGEEVKEAGAAEFSDENTPASSTLSMKLFMWYFEQCDPKKCSGVALKRMGMLRTIPLKSKFNGIVLTPATDKMISLADAELLTEYGAAVIDCSWAFFDSVKVRSNRSRERILPNLLAANPVNYGKEFKLNCAEALAAAYFLCGFESEAHEIMSHFKWGPAFFAVNEFRFSKYRGCQSTEEMLAAQEQVLEELRVDKEEMRSRAIEMPSSDSEDEDEAAYLQSLRDRHKDESAETGAAATTQVEEDSSDSDQEEEKKEEEETTNEKNEQEDDVQVNVEGAEIQAADKSENKSSDVGQDEASGKDDV